MLRKFFSLKPRSAPRMIVAIGLVVLYLVAFLVATRMVVHTPSPSPSRADPDYQPSSQARCFSWGQATQPTGPQPAPDLAPVGQPAEVDSIRYQVPVAAQQQDEIGGQHARGVFLVAQLSEQYVGTDMLGLTMIPGGVQLVDRTGTVHCAVTTPTWRLNPSHYPSQGIPGLIVPISINPGDPPVTLSLVFDVDPGQAQGAYLRAFNRTGSASVSLDLGLT